MSTSGSPAHSSGSLLREAFYRRDALVVATELLNKVLCHGGVEGRIIEVEAYRRDDPASHSFRGPTVRNETMFVAGGVLYVYLSYGIHHCINVVTGEAGDGQAVLLRAVELLEGDELVAERRGGRPRREWANGPGKLARSFAIDRSHDGADLTTPGGITLHDDGVAPPDDPLVTPRVGISRASDVPWRWLVPVG